ncbi:hypothetical protein PA0153 [Candidatus Phytoplasma australiense]|uniref:Transmembrane protein n=1 Tax=Phytoplasma australiense TaxID=59748 RepID=B1V956_PHYAS|nr:hypothetical protein PA0153 [Candidatus Phytoplasma australiense]
MNQNYQQYPGQQPNYVPNEQKPHISIKFSVGRVFCFIILICVFATIRNGYFESLVENTPENLDYVLNPSEENKQKLLEAAKKFDKDYEKSQLISWAACFVIPALICFFGKKG